MTLTSTLIDLYLYCCEIENKDPYLNDLLDVIEEILEDE